VRDAILVLPLKILRGRPDAEFLAFSLPDAIASSLADHPTIAVRSPLAVQRHGAEADLEMLAEVMSARFALTGTPACVDERIGIRLQLLAIPAGRVLWSTSRVATLQEVFEVQDAVAVQVARALPANMAARPFAERPRDVPKNAGAYAFYLRRDLPSPHSDARRKPSPRFGGVSAKPPGDRTTFSHILARPPRRRSRREPGRA
jgi:TolB-like protein